MSIPASAFLNVIYRLHGAGIAACSKKPFRQGFSSESEYQYSCHSRSREAGRTTHSHVQAKIPAILNRPLSRAFLVRTSAFEVRRRMSLDETRAKCGNLGAPQAAAAQLGLKVDRREQPGQDLAGRGPLLSVEVLKHGCLVRHASMGEEGREAAGAERIVGCDGLARNPCERKEEQADHPRALSSGNCSRWGR